MIKVLQNIGLEGTQHNKNYVQETHGQHYAKGRKV